MSQSHTHSALEALTNVLVGFGVNYAANLVVLPLFGLAVTPKGALGIGAVFTVVSLVRGFVLRRVFNRWHA